MGSIGEVQMLSADKIELGYRGHSLCANLDFHLDRGEICAVIGHNGSGKSTLVRTLLGIQQPISGTINWSEGRPENIAYLGQSSHTDNHFPLRVKDVVAMGAWRSLGFWSGLSQHASDKVDNALHRTGLVAMADRPLFECSSGQLQRCFFARAIVQDAPVIILDEPFTAIDQSTEEQLIDIIKQWRSENRTLVIVLHDLSSVMTISDHCLLLGNGRATFGRTNEIVTTENLLSHNYLTNAQAQWIATLTQSGGQNV
ncbi:MAG: metal ABC transporter ATP-binding protein [Candidatus Puniceispirillaceae bacterium]